MTQDSALGYVPEERFPEDRLRALGLAVASFGPFLVTGVFVAFRGNDVVAANIALAFVVVVILAAAAGGRAAGAIAAVVSTMAYDFFFTHPYQSLKIERAEDIGTAVLLLAIGLLVAQLRSSPTAVTDDPSACTTSSCASTRFPSSPRKGWRSTISFAPSKPS